MKKVNVMIFDCSSKKAYLTAPVVFAVCVLALFVTWLVLEPAAVRHMFDGASFDQDGHSVFELATIPFYAAIIPLVWWKCPFTGSRRRRALLCAAVSCVAEFFNEQIHLDDNFTIPLCFGLIAEFVSPFLQ